MRKSDVITLEDWITKNSNKSPPLALAAQAGSGGVARIRVANLVADLSHVIERTEDADRLKNAVSYDCLRTLRDWLLPDVEELFDLVSWHSAHVSYEINIGCLINKLCDFQLPPYCCASILGG